MRITLSLRTRKSPFSIPWMLALGCALAFVFVLGAPAHAQTFTYTSLYQLQCITNNEPTGCFPDDVGMLTLWGDLSVYGTTASSLGCGTIFNLAFGLYSDVYAFGASAGGCKPVAALTPAFDPKTSETYLYGATETSPTLFRYDPSSGTLKVLRRLAKQYFQSPPIVGKDGNLYDVNNLGVPYQINVENDAVTELSGTAAGPLNGPLLLAADGNLYGVTCGFGTQNTVFIMAAMGVINTIYPFSTPDCPSGGLTQLQGSTSNILYGVATMGGGSDSGYIFEVATDGTGFNDLHDFTGADGSAPQAGLLAAADGNLYGTTTSGGANGDGTIFELTPTATGWSFTKLFDFSGTSGAVPGDYDVSTLMEYPDGSFYGAAAQGGISSTFGQDGQGVLYKVTPFNPFTTVTLCCNTFVILDQPVQIYGLNMDEVEAVSFAGAPAQFQQISPSYLTAQVPAAAVDGQVTVTVINSAGEPQQVESQQTLHILPTITTLDPTHGAVGSEVLIEGGGFANASEVTFGGVPATSFSVQAPNVIAATVPTGAATGKITVTTSNGTATSKQKFTVK